MKHTLLQFAIITAMLFALIPAHINPAGASVAAEDSIIARPTEFSTH